MSVPAPPPQVPQDVRKAVVDAYYPKALAVADSARSRAQAGYGVASAIAAALVAAGVFGDLDERSTLVQVLGLVALGAWLVAASFFLYAVSAPLHEAIPPQEGVEKFANAVLHAATEEQKDVDSRARVGRFASVVAAVLTVLAFGFAVFSEVPSKASAGTVSLTAKGVEAVAEKCRTLTATFAGRVDKADLEKEFVNITVEGRACGEKDAVISVPRAQVRGVVFSP